LGTRISALLNDPWLSQGISLVIELVVTLGLVYLFRRFLDKKSFRSLGFQQPQIEMYGGCQLSRGWWHDWLGGFAVSLAAWGAIFALALVFGAVTITGWRVDARLLALGLVSNLFVGLVEETETRGYVMQNLAEGVRVWPAVLISSAYFAVLHLLNPGAGLGSLLGIFVAGVVLALGYYATGRLWFSMGMHTAWNFAEGPLFGFRVSGLDLGGVFQLRESGPDWLMGGNFGPEAGALAIGVQLVLIAVLYAWTRWRVTGDT
jgi:membrane protease YdiL (CAAX protease family)